MSNTYLLDTHVLLWFLSGEDSLSTKVKQILKDTSNPCFVSIASIWEIAIKLKIGKLQLDYDFDKLAELLYDNEIDIIQLTFDHVSTLLSLDDFHRDPFDRIILSTAKFEQMSVISKDQAFLNYKGVEVIW